MVPVWIAALPMVARNDVYIESYLNPQRFCGGEDILIAPAA